MTGTLGFFEHVHRVDGMIRLTRWRLIELVAWLAAGVAGWHFLVVWNAPGQCLSSGKAFDFDTWTCGDAYHYPYRDVPVYSHAALWWWVAALVVAISIRILRGQLRRRSSGAAPV